MTCINPHPTRIHRASNFPNSNLERGIKRLLKILFSSLNTAAPYLYVSTAQPYMIVNQDHVALAKIRNRFASRYSTVLPMTDRNDGDVKDLMHHLCPFVGCVLLHLLVIVSGSYLLCSPHLILTWLVA